MVLQGDPSDPSTDLGPTCITARSDQYCVASHSFSLRGKWNDTLFIPTRALVDIRVDTSRPSFPDKRGQSRTPTKHRIIRTTIRRHARGGTHRLIADYADAWRRGGGGSVACHTFQILSAHHLRHLFLSSGLYPFLPLMPFLLRPGHSERGHGRSAGLPSEPVPPRPLPLIVVPHRRGVTRLLWCIPRRHSLWRRIRRGLGRGARGTHVYSLAVLPARLACADARFEHFASGRATALFSRGGQHLHCAFFKVLAYYQVIRYFRSVRDSIRAFWAIFVSDASISYLSHDERK